MITSINEFSNISENLKYHIENGIDIIENIFRHGSDAYIHCIKETRDLFDDNKITLSGIDEKLYLNTDIGYFGIYENMQVPLDLPMEYIEEAKTKDNKEVKLNYPMRGGSKKYYVYVKTKEGKIKKISFGDTTGLNAKVSNPEARKSFAARHQCKLKTDKTTAGYWACRINRYAHLWNGKTYPGYW